MKLRPGPTGIRDRIAALATRPPFTLAVIGVTAVLMAVYGRIGYMTGLAVALVVLWATRWDLARFGLGDTAWRRHFGRTLLQALAWVLASLVVVDVVLTPVVERLTGEPHDYSRFAFLEGNLRNLVLFTIFMWVAAAFGEEFFYRGYVMKQLAEILGGGNCAWAAGVMLSSVVFGVVHWYQGASGIITTGTMGLILGTAFYLNRRNLALCMLVHGLYNMVNLTLIYLGDPDALQRITGG